MNLKRKRLAIVATHPIQYQVPLWRSLAQLPELDVHVYFGSDFSVRGFRDSGFGVMVKWDVPLIEGYAHTFLSTDVRISGMDGFFTLRASNLAQYLRDFRPDCALINAYMPFFWWEAVWILRSLNIPILVRAEATDVAVSRGWLKSQLRSLSLRLFYRQCARFLAIGQNAREHYLSKGIPVEQIGWSPYCVDSEMVENQVSKYVPQRSRLRQELGFADSQTVFIFSGKLIAKKDPLMLVRAFQAMSESERQQVGLIVLGDGNLRQSVERECYKALGSRAVFTGFVNQSQIGRYYAAADCLILPSSGETWGLVVNETLQFGLPVIISDRVGCRRDLVVEDQTGYVFPVGDEQALRMCMVSIIDMLSDHRQSVVERCREQVARYSTQKAVEGIRQAVMSL